MDGFDDEIAFWDEQISGRGPYSEGVLNRLDLSKQPGEYRWDFEPLVMRLGADCGRKGRVLDVGSGPASIFSYGHHTGRIEVVAADPLADAYKAILRRHKFQPTSPMVTCGGEALLDHFPPDHFDLTWSFNSIDHSTSPLDVFHRMVDVTRPGGIIAIQVFENEGDAADWTGLHQHNISISPGGEMTCCRRHERPRVMRHPRAERYTLDFQQAYFPETVGRAWLAFFYRKR